MMTCAAQLLHAVAASVVVEQLLAISGPASEYHQPLSCWYLSGCV